MAGVPNEQLAHSLRVAGWSHGEVARRVNERARELGQRHVAVDAARVGRWVRGERPRSPVVQILADLLAAHTGMSLTPASLGLVALDWDPVTPEWVGQTMPQSLITFTAGDMLSRREIARLAVGPILLGTVHRLAGAALPPIIDQPQGRIGAREMAALETVVNEFRRFDAAHGGALIRKSVVGQLNAAAELLRDGQSPDITTRLYAVVADLGLLAGWMSHDAGLFGTAQRYWLYGLSAARAGDDLGRSAEIISRMSHQMIYFGDFQAAVALLDVAGRAASRSGIDRLRGMLAAQRGRVLAGLGDDRGCRTGLAEAMTLLARAEETGEVTPDWIAYFTHAELAGAAAVSRRDLQSMHGRKVQPASVEFRQALALREPGYDRCRAMDLVGLSAAYLAEQEPERACAVAHEALDLAETLDSSLIRSRVLTLVEAAGPYRTNTNVRDLFEKARTVPQKKEQLRAA